MIDVINLEKEEMGGYLPNLDIPEGFVLAGGAIRRWFTGEKQDSDFDYFRIDGKEEYRPPITGLIEQNSTIVQTTYRLGNKKIQAIKRKYNSVSELLDSFDFHHCQFAYDGKRIFTTKKALISTMRKHLSFNNVIEGFELDTLRRAFKYQQQGYTPCSGTIGDLGNMLKETESDLDEQLQMSPSGGKKKVIRFD